MQFLGLLLLVMCPKAFPSKLMDEERCFGTSELVQLLHDKNLAQPDSTAAEIVFEMLDWDSQASSFSCCSAT